MTFGDCSCYFNHTHTHARTHARTCTHTHAHTHAHTQTTRTYTHAHTHDTHDTHARTHYKKKQLVCRKHGRYGFKFSVALRPQRRSGLLGAQDGHLHFHTAPGLCRHGWVINHGFIDCSVSPTSKQNGGVSPKQTGGRLTKKLPTVSRKRME